MAAHRYWRVYIRTNNGSLVACDCAILELRASPGGADQTGSGTASASNVESPNYASNAFDGNPADFWGSYQGSGGAGGPPQWLQYDFGAGNAVVVEEISWTARNDSYGPNESPKDFDIQYSDDGTTWTTLWTPPSQTGWAQGETRVFTGPAGPDTPTVAVSGITRSTATLTGSAYVNGQGYAQKAAQWQITLATDTTFATPVIDTGEDLVDLLAYAASGLAWLSDFICRVRYEDSTSTWSSWSASVAFSTLANQPPATPTLTGYTDGRKVYLIGSNYSDPEGDVQTQAEWQVDVTGGDFSAPLIDDTSTTQLTSASYSDPGISEGLIARVRYYDGYDWSGWSTQIAIAQFWDECIDPNAQVSAAEGPGTYAAEVIADGATNFWECQDASGLLVDAISGTATATVTGGTYHSSSLLVNEPNGYSIALAAGHIMLPNIDISNKSFTLECIIKVDEPTSAPLWIWDFYNFFSTDKEVHSFIGGLLVTGFNFYSDDMSSGEGPFDPRVPLHLVLRFDLTSGEAAMFMNGALVVSGTHGPLAAAPTWCAFGLRENGADPFTGQVSHLAIYEGIALGDTEIASHAAHLTALSDQGPFVECDIGRSTCGDSAYASAVLADNPVLFWQFCEAAGAQTVYDSSPNGIDGSVLPGSELGVAGLLAGSQSALGSTATPSDTSVGIWTPQASWMHAGYLSSAYLGFEFWFQATDVTTLQTLLNMGSYVDFLGATLMSQWSVYLDGGTLYLGYLKTDAYDPSHGDFPTSIKANGGYAVVAGDTYYVRGAIWAPSFDIVSGSIEVTDTADGIAHLVNVPGTGGYFCVPNTWGPFWVGRFLPGTVIDDVAVYDVVSGSLPPSHYTYKDGAVSGYFAECAAVASGFVTCD